MYTNIRVYAVRLSSVMEQRQASPRTPLSRSRVLQAAVALADESGLDGFGMRRLAQRLGVVPMALYKHVRNKEELLQGMIDTVFSEIEVPTDEDDWRSAMRRRANSTRDALKRHSWAIGLMETAAPGPANLENHDAVLGWLRTAGFSFEAAIHAYSLQDAYIYGFALQEKTLGFDRPDSAGKAAQRRADTLGADALAGYPHLAEVVIKLAETGYDNSTEFAWGLNLILDGLERLRHEPEGEMSR